MSSSIEEEEVCFDVVKTECKEKTESVDTEICTYVYEDMEVLQPAKTIEVEFEKKCQTHVVTVCEPGNKRYNLTGTSEALNTKYIKYTLVIIFLIFPQGIIDTTNSTMDLAREATEDMGTIAKRLSKILVITNQVCNLPKQNLHWSYQCHEENVKAKPLSFQRLIVK